MSTATDDDVYTVGLIVILAQISLAFLVLKLSHHIHWSWWWVWSPFWITLVFIIFAGCLSALAGAANKWFNN